MKKFYLSLLSFLFYFISNGQIINFSDPNFKAKLVAVIPTDSIASTQPPDQNGNVTSYNKIDTNNDGEIQISEALAIKFLNLYGSSISNLDGIQYFTNLQFLDSEYNQITSLNLTALTSLIFLKCGYNQLTSLNIQGLNNLQSIECNENQLTALNVQGFINLKKLVCNFNELSSLNIQGVTTLKYLECKNNYISNLNLNSLTNLITLICGNNYLTNLNLSNLINLVTLECNSNGISILNLLPLNNLQNLNCEFNQISALNVQGLNNLVSLKCNHNNITSLDVHSLASLQTLICAGNQMTTLNVQGLSNIITLICDGNFISSLNLQGLNNLQTINCSSNELNSLNFQGLTNLKNLYCSQNNLVSLNISGLINLENLICGSNQLSSLNLVGLTNLDFLECSYNQITSLDFQSCTNIEIAHCENNQLNNLNIKNGPNYLAILFEMNSTLQYVCVDEEDVVDIQNKINQYGYTATCQVNTYCSFTPGGIIYSVQGNNRFDSNSNGCDINDVSYPNLKFNITNGTTSGTLISNSLGNYSIPVSAGTHTFIPQLENPTYFTVSPTTANVTFPATASPFTQNFCLTANGVRHDLEIVIIPITPARPGFDATYKLKYKNKGNQIENATLVFNYNENVLDLVSTSVVPTSQNTGVLNWNLGTLNPFQQGEIQVTLNLNSPTETPALNSGSILNYTANINGLNTDETLIDNTSSLNQTVVNSFDPNDKRCIEGNTINSAMIGQYVHYMIRFENTGTFPAQNIVVKDMIDLSKFEIASLQMTDASHICYTRLNGNKVEFIFENINLDFNDATNDGYVVFKIKTKSTLTVGSQITNNANIYFDYNFPIVTNTETSTFQVLNVDNFDFGNYFTIYPNPAKDILNIKAKQNIEISSVTIYNLLGQIVQTITQPTTIIDVSDLKTGNYFLKVTTDKGTSSTKFIKE